jgi:hypothetical protein
VGKTPPPPPPNIANPKSQLIRLQIVKTTFPFFPSSAISFMQRSHYWTSRLYILQNFLCMCTTNTLNKHEHPLRKILYKNNKKTL